MNRMVNTVIVGGARFTKGEHLDEIIAKMIADPELHDHLRTTPNQREELMNAMDLTLAEFRAAQAPARYRLHRTLASLYELHLGAPGKRVLSNQFDTTLMEVRRELEGAWMRFERSRLGPGDAWLVEPGRFPSWLKGVVLQHPAADHPLFRYMEMEADRSDVIRFVAGEVAVDTRFDDLLALVQIGMESASKMELAANYWDEMGNGNMGDVHTHMFAELLGELGSTEPAPAACSTTDWTALACANLLLYTAIHRKELYRALGALAAVELTVPLRFARLVRGFERIGLSARATRYHSVHVAVDARHATGWLRNVIAPIVSAAPDARREIFEGAIYRLNTSLDYCDGMLESCRGQRDHARS